MASRRAIQSVVDNFLGTHTSRYTAYRGYCLFGFLVEKIDRVRFDLLSTEPAVLEFEALSSATT